MQRPTVSQPFLPKPAAVTQVIDCSSPACEQAPTDGPPLMIIFVSLLPALLGLAASDHPQARTSLVQNEFVTRVPVRARPTPPRFEWEEVRGPKCIASRHLEGALLSGSEHVDFVMRSN